MPIVMIIALAALLILTATAQQERQLFGAESARPLRSDDGRFRNAPVQGFTAHDGPLLRGRLTEGAVST